MNTTRLSYADIVLGTIRAYLARQKITQRQLADMIGKPEDWVSRRLRGTNLLTVNDVETFALALDLPPNAFFIQDVIAC